MKKVIIGILLLVIIVVSVFFSWYNRNVQRLKDVKKFNSQFEDYLNRDINGVDLTTIINKAIENNNKYNIKKDSKGVYLNDNNYYINIIIKPQEDGKSFLMEAFEQVGIKEFTKGFGGIVFKSTKVEYHKNGRISKIYFDIQNIQN